MTATITFAPSRLKRQYRVAVDGRYSAKFLTLKEAQAYVTEFFPTHTLTLVNCEGK